ncbi:MAG TPA: hypothetical protein VGB07_11875 [Blastocatellia bacterium]
MSDKLQFVGGSECVRIGSHRQTEVCRTLRRAIFIVQGVAARYVRLLTDVGAMGLSGEDKGLSIEALTHFGIGGNTYFYRWEYPYQSPMRTAK